MTLVFIHGAGSNSFIWHLQLTQFKDAIAVNLPGHPEGSGFSTIPEYADWVREYLQKEAIQSPVLVGHSMGGAIAIESAFSSPNLAGIVLVGTGARLRVHHDILTELQHDYKKAAELIAAWSVARSYDPRIMNRIAEETLKTKREVTYWDFMACDKFDRMNEVERIPCKTLVVCGQDDKLTPVKYSQYLNQKIRNSKLIVIPGAGHSVMLERPREFNNELEAFVASISS